MPLCRALAPARYRQGVADEGHASEFVHSGGSALSAMVSEIELRSVSDALAFIVRQDAERNQRGANPLLLRGESSRHPSLLPSVYRVNDADRSHTISLVSSLSLHLLSDYLGPHLDFRADGPYYKGKWVGRRDWGEATLADPSFLWVLWQVESVLQHYGWPTPWLDVTFDPRVAVFFACLDYPNQRIVTEGNGYIYAWHLSTIRGQADLAFDAPVVDLKPICGVLAGVFRTASTRPEAQAAGSIRIPWTRPTIEARLRELRTILTFPRHDALETVGDYGTYFPDDPLLGELQAFEDKYLEYCQSVPPTMVGDDWPAFVDFLKTRCARKHTN